MQHHMMPIEPGSPEESNVDIGNEGSTINTMTYNLTKPATKKIKRSVKLSPRRQ